MILVADPPWRFGDKLPGPGRGAEKHYATMSFEEICRFPVPDADVLFLWKVAAMPFEALFVAEEWGFQTPMRELVWVKLTKDESRVRQGMGHVVRNSHETCLIATKKGRKIEILNRNVPSVFYAPRSEHSAKPDAFYEAVERLYPGPYVELFARRRRPGWECHGDELR